MCGDCLKDDVLLQLVEGELPDKELSKIDRHLDSCPHCRQRLDRITSPKGSRDQASSEVGMGSAALESLIDRLQTNGIEGAAGLDTSLGSTEVGAQQETRTTQRLTNLDHYQVLEEVGSGASGRLYRAHDQKLDRVVALKVLQDFLVGNAQALARLDREAKAAAGLSHDHIVTLHEIATPADRPPYLVLEYVEGESLKERIEQDGALEPKQAAIIVAQIASGLQAAHENGVIHRDVKSSNILIDAQTTRAKITDFGLARDSAADSQLTIDGSIAGTPAYMSPEQITDPSRVDARSDVYSLGVVLYECLTGSLPFLGTPRMTLIQAQHVEPCSPRQLNDNTPTELEIICLKALEKEPLARYASANAFAEDLQRYLDNRPILARPENLGRRMTKWIRRNPRVAALWTSIAVVFALAALVSTASAIKLSINESALRDAEQQARRSAAAASTQRDIALRTLRKLVVDVPKALEEVPADTSDVETLVSRIAVEGLEEIASSEDASGVNDLHTAMGRFQLGATLWRVGDLAEAETHLQRAQAILASLKPTKDETQQWTETAVQTQWYLSWIDWDLEAEADSLAHLQAALQIVESSLQQDRGSSELTHLLHAQTLNHLAELAIDTDQIASARTRLSEASAILKEVRSRSDNDDVLFEMKINRQLSRELDRNGRRVGELSRSLPDLIPPESLDALPGYVVMLLKRADASALADDSDAEIEELSAARDALRRMIENDAKISEKPVPIGLAHRRQQWTQVLLRLADLQRNLGDWKQARKNYQRVTTELGIDGPSATASSIESSAQRVALIHAKLGLAAILQGRDRYEQAAPALETLHTQLETLDASDANITRLQADAKLNLAWCLDWDADLDRARTLANQASQMVQKLRDDQTARKAVDWRRWSEDKDIELSLLIESLDMF